MHGFLQHKNQSTVKTTEAPVETEHGQDYWVSSVETRISAAIATVKTTGAPVETGHGQDYWVSSVETRISAAIATVKTTGAPVETEHGQDYWVSSVETRVIATVKTTEAPVETGHGQDYWVSSVETRITELYPRYTPATWGSGPGETTNQLRFPREGLRSQTRRYRTALKHLIPSLIGAQLAIVFMESLITDSLICVTVQVKHPSYYE